MVCRTDTDIGFLPKQPAIIMPFVKNTLQDNKIKFSLIKQLQKSGGVVHKDFQLIFRLFQEPSDVRKQHILSDGFGCAYP